MGDFAYDASNVFIGIGDAVSLGLTAKLRQKPGTDDAVNKCSGAYKGGQIAGTLIDLYAGGVGFKLIGRVGEGLSAFERAAEFGVRPYNELRGLIKGTELQAHHLIEKRFAELLGVEARKMESIALTKAEHQVFTNNWRKAISYGEATANATRGSGGTPVNCCVTIRTSGYA